MGIAPVETSFSDVNIWGDVLSFILFISKTLKQSHLQAIEAHWECGCKSTTQEEEKLPSTMPWPTSTPKKVPVLIFKEGYVSPRASLNA